MKAAHSSVSSQDFLHKLEQEAQLQAELHRHRLLPSQLDVVTSLVGNYPWQVIVFVSGVTALLLEWW